MADRAKSPAPNHLPRFFITLGISIGLSQALAFFCSPRGEGTLAFLAMTSFAIHWTVFAHASGLLFGNERTEKFYDLTGSIAFLTTSTLSVVYAPGQLSSRSTLLTGAVILWTLRLGSFLFGRIQATGKDSRFDKIKPSLLRFFAAWTLSGLWVFVTALPVFAVNASSHHPSLGFRDYLGLSLWVFGFALEIVADTQKDTWRSQKANHGKFINTGVWALSRHPNYFGEITLWLGIFISASSAFSTPGMWSSVLSPVLVFLLLVYVSGIKLLEAAGDKKWGKEQNYITYKQQTPVLIPFVGRAGDATW